MKEINLKLETIEVKAECRPHGMSVRSVFYRGIFGKIKTIWYWIFVHNDKTFKEYLDSSVTYSREIGIDIHYGMDCEEELTQALTDELKKEINE